MPEYDLKHRDFSLQGDEAEPKTFTVGKDEFVAPPVIPPVLLGDLAAASQGFGDLKGDVPAQLEKVASIFDLLLTPETAPRFRERLLSRTEPIDLNRQALPIMHWLMEVYGLRPTEPSSSSGSGVNGGGPGSTDGAPNTESTL